MANENGRKALRGEEKRIFDLVSETCSPQQWAEWLKPLLECAATQGDKGLTQKLVLAGAETGQAVHSAVRKGHGEIVDFLLENGAPIGGKDLGGSTPLHVAAYDGNVQMVRSLLLKGADKDAYCYERRTSLHWAARLGYVAVTKALLTAGADLTLRGEPHDSSPLDAAAHGGHVDILRAFIKHGVEVNAASSSGTTALHIAAASNKVGGIDVLVGAGANIEAIDAYGCTALHAAASQAGLETAVALLKHYGADVNAKDTGIRTPLHWAAGKTGKQGAAEMVEILLRWGADEMATMSGGQVAADVVGVLVEEQESVAEDIERVRKLLANAPADRAWRRRGLLVLCRAHPDRVQLRQESRSTQDGMVQGTRGHAKLAKTEASTSSGGGATHVGSSVDEMTGDDLTGVATTVLGLKEEGIFRTIVGYL